MARRGSALRAALGCAGAAAAGLAALAAARRPHSVYADEPGMRNPLEGRHVRFVPDDSEPENADGACGRLEDVGPAEERRPGAYEQYFKRAFDVALSLGGLVALSPVMAALAVWVYADDPGPVIFEQRRVGRGGRYFRLHKFRSMRLDAPHDVPTHMLADPASHITAPGALMRAHSLDELPQLWDVLQGNMSLVGPRPALWNQDVLVAERDRWGANAVTPGITGPAQVGGRDELTLQEKARLDGGYARALAGGRGPATDLRCLLATMGVIAHDDTVVEGGTGAADCEAA